MVKYLKMNPNAFHKHISCMLAPLGYNQDVYAKKSFEFTIIFGLVIRKKLHTDSTKKLLAIHSTPMIVVGPKKH